MNKNHSVNSSIESGQYDSPFYKIKCLQVSECNILHIDTGMQKM